MSGLPHSAIPAELLQQTQGTVTNLLQIPLPLGIRLDFHDAEGYTLFIVNDQTRAAPLT